MTTIAEGFVLDDGRPGVACVFTHEESVASYRYMYDVAELRLDQRVLASRGDRLALVESHATGGEQVLDYEVDTLVLVELDRNGLVARHTMFESDGRAEAFAELDVRAEALDADPLAIPRNRAAQAVEQEGWVLRAALMDEVCVHETPDGFVVHDVDDDGRVVARLAYKAGDLRSAADEANRRFSTRHGFPAAAASMLPAMNARDLSAVRACLSEACTFEDHRTLRVLALGDAEQYRALLGSTFELLEDYVVEMLRVSAVESWGHVVLICMSGSMADSGPFETPCVAMSAWDDEGCLARVALYEPEDVDAAVALLHGLAR